MAAATISRWARRFLVIGVAFLTVAQIVGLAGAPRSVEVILGLYGFVLSVVFGKAYSLLPSYFDRTLAVPRAPAWHLPIHTLGVLALAGAAWPGTPTMFETAGRVLWSVGVVIFAVSIALTIRSNPLGLETGTSGANASRAGLDRIANLFMPAAPAYLLIGTLVGLAAQTGLSPPLDGSSVRVHHLLAAGFALLLLFSVGYRLLPRFLVAQVPRSLAIITLPAGALGPALLAIGYPSGPLFAAGAILESVAIASFAIAYGWLFVATDRDRIGFYGPLGGVIAGLFGIGLGLHFALVGFEASLILSHVRLNVFGLLGLSIIGIIFQFYPPAVSNWPVSGDHLAGASLAVYASGVGILAAGPPIDGRLSIVGHILAFSAALTVGYCLIGTIRAQTAGR
ncbi:MAG: hypothetical protein ABEH64_08035 [Salinirussus sp.]